MHHSTQCIAEHLQIDLAREAQSRRDENDEIKSGI